MLRFRRRVLRRTLISLLTAAALAVPTAGWTSAASADESAPAVTGTPCAPGEGVTVEVDFLKAGETPDDPAQDRVVLGCAEGPQSSGFEALANAGFTTSSESGPGTICRIDALPAQGMPYCWLTGGYWSYWRSNGTDAWAYSQVGAGNTGTIPVDSVEGWAFTMLDDPWESTQPRVAVADLGDYLPDETPVSDVPSAPVLSDIAASETLPFSKPAGSTLEVAVLGPGADLATAEWRTRTTLPLAAYEGQTIRVLARVKGEDDPAFDATYRVRATYPPGRDLGTQGNPDVSVPYADARIVGWATGTKDYAPGTNVADNWKNPDNATGPVGDSNMGVVVLGDHGTITLTFDRPITDGDGADFAVFENGFRVSGGNLDFLELGRVAVSSNGTDFATFDSASQRATAVGAYEGQSAAEIGGLAGRDLNGNGTPFDLAVLRNAPEVRSGAVDLDAITDVKVIDVVGDGNDLDSFGRPIYEPFPTYGSGGFDLSGVAVLHEAAPPAPTVSGEGCAPGTGVTTVVDYDKAGKNEIVIGCADGDQVGGFAALEAAGHTLESVPDIPGGLCKLDGFPEAGYPFCWEFEDTNGYWGYYLEDGEGGWKESQLGGGDLTQPLAKGSVIAWHFGLYGDGWPNPPRITLDEVAEHAPEGPGPTEPTPTDPTPTTPPRPVLGAKRLSVAATAKPVVRGKQLAVRAGGLAPRERFTVRVAGRTVRTGTASPAGGVSVKVRVPKAVAQGKRALTVVGSRPSRVGTRTVTVVKPRFKASVRKKSVRVGGTQVITLKRLVAGERIVVTINGKRVSPKAAKANRNGVYRLRIKVGAKPGRKTVKATSVKGRGAKVRYVVRRR